MVMVMILQMLMTITMLMAMMLMKMIAVKTIKWAFTCWIQHASFYSVALKSLSNFIALLLHLQVLVVP